MLQAESAEELGLLAAGLRRIHCRPASPPSPPRPAQLVSGGAPSEAEDDLDAEKRKLQETASAFPPPKNPLRFLAWKVATNAWFDRLILAVILLNAFFMAVTVSLPCTGPT